MHVSISILLSKHANAIKNSQKTTPTYSLCLINEGFRVMYDMCKKSKPNKMMKK